MAMAVTSSSHAGLLCVVSYNVGVTSHTWCTSQDSRRQAHIEKKWKALTADTKAMVKPYNPFQPSSSHAGKPPGPTPNLIIFQEVGPQGEVNEQVRGMCLHGLPLLEPGSAPRRT